MKIEDLRSLGNSLYREIFPLRKSFISEESIGRGAGGDKTFLIDKKAEDIILEKLKELKEPLSIVSEECGLIELNGGGKIVLIDPIDGSKNAINGIPFYCTSIAIADDDTIGSVKMSYVINLLTGDEFYAERGKGAFMNDRKIKIENSKNKDIRLVAYEAQVPGSDIPRIMSLIKESKRTRCLGATALDLCHVAQGSIDVFVSPSPSRSFDFAGGWLIIKESGGVFTDMEGNNLHSMKLGLKNRSTLLASRNAEIHRRALELLNKMD